MRYAVHFGFLVLILSTVSAARPAAPAAAPPGKKPAAATFEVYQDKAGEYRWRLRAQNGQIIASCGQGYTEKRSCLAGVESVKRDAAEAPIEEVDQADGGKSGGGQ